MYNSILLGLEHFTTLLSHHREAVCLALFGTSKSGMSSLGHAAAENFGPNNSKSGLQGCSLNFDASWTS